MARQSEDSRHSKYVIRIICEGEKTEPLFFTSLCDRLLDENDGRDVKTIPQPDKYDCMTQTAKENACHGEKCINGYARLKKYWNETKTSHSTFPLIEKRLKAGIINAKRLRIESDNKEICPIYVRNPYTDVDKLVCRLIHTKIISYGEECLFKDSKDELFIKMYKSVIIVCNKSSHTVVIPDGLLKIYNWETDKYESISDRSILSANEYTFWFFTLKKPEVILIERNETHSEYIFFPYYF